MEEEEEVGETPTLPEAIRKHLRPELVSRLTKVVHFKPLRMETVREILGKLMEEFNKRLVDRGVTVVLDDSAAELILREGSYAFSRIAASPCLRASALACLLGAHAGKRVALI